MSDDPLPSYDASDAVAENNARRDIERLAREDADVIRAIMHTKKGRAWMLRQLDRCYINSSQKFVRGEPDSTAHNLGRESYGLELLKDIMGASVDLYMQAIKEAEDEERRRASVRRSEQKRRDEVERPVNAQDQVAPLPAPVWPTKKT